MIDNQKQGDLHLVTMNDGPNTICPEWQQRRKTWWNRQRALATQLATKEPGIFKTLKQTWFGPMANALVAEAG